jgi:general secretion pathway protein G
MMKWLKHKMNAHGALKALKHDHQNDQGFTLVELMVVIVIIGLLATVVVINVLPSTDTASVTKARGDIATLEQAVDLYKLDNLVYPSTDQGLEALVTRPDGLARPERYRPDGYIRRLPPDPWGNPYQYSYPGENGVVDIFSLGADGRLGGEGLNADVGNWQTQ